MSNRPAHACIWPPSKLLIIVCNKHWQVAWEEASSSNGTYRLEIYHRCHFIGTITMQVKPPNQEPNLIPTHYGYMYVYTSNKTF